MVLDASLLNAQQLKRRIKGKWRNPGKGVMPSPTFGLKLKKRVPSGRPQLWLQNLISIVVIFTLQRHQLNVEQLPSPCYKIFTSMSYSCHPYVEQLLLGVVQLPPRCFIVSFSYCIVVIFMLNSSYHLQGQHGIHNMDMTTIQHEDDYYTT